MAPLNILNLPAEMRQQILFFALPQYCQWWDPKPSAYLSMILTCKQFKLDLEPSLKNWRTTIVLTYPEHLSAFVRGPLPPILSQMNRIEIHLLAFVEADQLETIAFTQPERSAKCAPHTGALGWYTTAAALPRVAHRHKAIVVDITPFTSWLEHDRTIWKQAVLTHPETDKYMMRQLSATMNFLDRLHTLYGGAKILVTGLPVKVVAKYLRFITLRVARSHSIKMRRNVTVDRITVKTRFER